MEYDQSARTLGATIHQFNVEPSSPFRAMRIGSNEYRFRRDNQFFNEYEFAARCNCGTRHCEHYRLVVSDSFS